MAKSNSSKGSRGRSRSKAERAAIAAENGRTRAETQILLEQLHIHQHELELQNEELRRVQEDLEASRARYFDLYNLAPVGYITVNHEGLILESNLRAASLFGVLHSKLNGRNFARSVAVPDGDTFYLANRRLFQSGAPQVCEVRLKRQDQSTFWGRLEMSLSPKRDGGGSGSQRIVIVDISERKLAEQRFDAFMRHTPAAASIVDEEGRYVYVNPALERYTGRASSDWMGKTFFQVWPPGMAQTLARNHSRALVTGETTTETETLPWGHQERVTQVMRFPFQGPNGKKLVGSVSIDVTDRHRLEGALREANAQLATEKNMAERATRAKSHFLSAMSHEIRTPLNGVIGMAGLLLHTELTNEQLGYARIVADSAELLLGLVDDVLDFSKIEAGKLELDEAPFDMERLVEDALSLMSFKAHEKSLELVSRYAAGTPRHFVGDAVRLRQILMNLLSNSVKFTQTGHVLVEVAAKQPSEGISNVRLSVEDTGIGISKENLSHLFTRFGQGDTSIAGRYGGSGLGLSIVKEVVELMGGEVGVESREGRGSTFYCQIPLRVEQRQMTPAPAMDDRLKGIPVLIACGQHISGVVISEWCQRWEMNVKRCGFPEIQPLLLQGNQSGYPYQAVIVDGGLDVLKQCAREFHAREKADAPKLILVRSAPRESTKDLVADAVLSTPVRMKVLWETLCELTATAATTDLPTTDQIPVGPSQVALPLTNCKVLVTDDNLINQKLASTLLRRMGCEVDTADNGLAALQKVKERRYDVVLMDCVMPEMDGFAATIAIRTLAGQAGSIPIVALTASATEEDRALCLAAGMNDFLTKPIRPEQLAQCLTRWLTRD